MTREQIIEQLDSIVGTYGILLGHGINSDILDVDDIAAIKEAISALSAERELTNEKAIAFLQDNGWLVEHDRIMTSGSAEGEYIKKEDAYNCFLKWRPYMATRIDKYEKEMSELPTYSFPDREKETPKLFIDNAVSKNCKNLSESYGEICVKCNKCGRFDNIGKAESEGE